MRLSVLLLCWNHARYLEQCLNSLAAQTVTPFEVLFLDNASTDGSFEIAEQLFARLGISATMLRNAAPDGISANFNRLLARASGELVSPLATDDWYDPAYVETILAAARDHPESGWFAVGGWTFDERTATSCLVDDGSFRSGEVLTSLLNGEIPFFFVGCCYRAQALREAGGWDEGQPVEDRDMFVRLAQRSTLTRVPQPLVFYRKSVGAASANPGFMVRGWEAFFDKHASLFGSALNTRMVDMYQRNAALAVDLKQHRLAIKLLTKALRRSPLHFNSWRTLSYVVRSASGLLASKSER